jgi:hypothetical protein
MDIDPITKHCLKRKTTQVKYSDIKDINMEIQAKDAGTFRSEIENSRSKTGKLR